LLYALTRTFRKEAVMTDEQRLEDTTEKLDDTDDVEAHRRRIAEEEKDADKSDDGDDVEAHRRR
jgi:uncharacterized protein with von Willebrand factor type A (vWA) domain